MAKSSPQKSRPGDFDFIGVLCTTNYIGILLWEDCMDPDKKNEFQLKQP